MSIQDYVRLLLQAIPSVVYEALLSIYCLGIVLLLAWKGKRIFRLVSLLTLLEYSLLIYSSTVFFRPSKEEREYSISLFWSYSRQDLTSEILMNVVSFVPIGFLLGCSFAKMSWRRIVLVGCMLSISIEMLQFIFRKGFSEIDDLVHNTIGCLLGYGIYNIFIYMRRRIVFDVGKDVFR